MDKVKLIKEIQNSLFSADTKIVLATIERIKIQGNKAYLPVLFDFLLAGPDKEIEIEILKLLETVKDPESVPVFVEAIQNSKYQSIQKKLLTCCWQNGLNFSDYIAAFVDVVIHGDWENSFEAFTVIENFEHSPGAEFRKLALQKIETAIGSATDQKKYFLEEIQKML